MVECVRVYKRDAERVLRLLKEYMLLERGYKLARLGDSVLIPVASSSEAVKVLREAGIDASNCEHEFEVRRKPRKLRELAGVEGVSSFLQIGDLAVFNFKEGGPSIDDYRLLAKALIEEYARIKSVWLKVYTEGEFRLQRLIHLAGERRTWTVHREYGLDFEVDIARVYFNPRLAFEHRRVAEETSNGERILDMFSGVGGFSIHIAALKSSSVVAVDLNPAAVYYAARNVARNKNRLKGYVSVMWADSGDLPWLLKPVFNRIVMNHPTASKLFSQTACRLSASQATVHMYMLSVSCATAVDEAERSFEGCCRAEAVSCREVLDYSPSTAVYAVDLKIKRSSAPPD